MRPMCQPTITRSRIIVIRIITDGIPVSPSSGVEAFAAAFMAAFMAAVAFAAVEAFMVAAVVFTVVAASMAVVAASAVIVKHWRPAV